MRLLSNRNFKKLIFSVAIIMVLAGCTANLDKEGNLIASRIIDETTKWSFSQGWFDFLFVMPLAKLILSIGEASNYVIGIVLVTLIVNLIMLPFMIKSTVMSQKMQLLQPQLEKIQQKYRGRNDQASQARMSQEVNNLYSKNDIKMGQTIIMPFLTMPIMLAMWQAVQRIPHVYNAEFLGLNLGFHPMNMIKTGHFSYLILVIVLGVFQYATIEITNYLNKRNPKYRAPKVGSNNNMKLMNIYMLVLIVFMSLNMPTAMSVYWIVTSLISIVRSIYIHYAYTMKM